MACVLSDKSGRKEDRKGLGGQEVHLERSENELARGLAALRPSQREGKGLFSCAVVVDESELFDSVNSDRKRIPTLQLNSV